MARSTCGTIFMVQLNIMGVGTLPLILLARTSLFPGQLIEVF